MIKHIVFWKILSSDDKESVFHEIKQRLDPLKKVIPELVELEVGYNFNVSKASYDVCLFTTFRSKEDLAKYQSHPEHVAAADFIKSVVSERAVVDYE